MPCTRSQSGAGKRPPLMRYDTVSKRVRPVCFNENAQPSSYSCIPNSGPPDFSSLIGCISCIDCAGGGTSFFTVPANATRLIVICIGAGGSDISGGGGGGLAWSYDIPCTPGQVFPIFAGSRTSATTFGDPKSGPYLSGSPGSGRFGGSFSGTNVNLLGGVGGDGGGSQGGGAGGYYGSGGSPRTEGSGGGGAGAYSQTSPGGGVGFNYYEVYNGSLSTSLAGSVGVDGKSYGGGSSSGGNDAGGSSIFIGWY